MAIDPTEARWFRKEQALARAMLRVYESARKELLAGLIEAGPEAQGLTVVHRQAMLSQVDAIIAKLQTETGILLFRGVQDALGDGNGSAAREVATLAGKPDLTVALSRLNPQLVEYHVTRAGEYLKTANENLRSQIRAELAIGQAQGLHAREVARRIAGRTDLKANEATFKKPVFQSAKQRAEVIARTEFATAANGAFEDTLRDAAEQGLPVGKRWSATLDNRTSSRCRSLHAKYNRNPIPLDQPFEAPDGWSGMGAPAHPQCRSRIMTGWLE